MKRWLLTGLSAVSFLFASGQWSYEGHTGPKYWGDLDKKFIMCKIGKNQSPVDLNRFIKGCLKELDISYNGKAEKVVNNGHTIKVKTEGHNFVVVDGIKFYLKQFHFHTPSENKINGIQYPMEAHFVHLDKNGNITVLAVMFKEGHYNKTMQKIIKSMPKHPHSEKELSYFNPKELLPSNKEYYRFNGSLTTPPCSEGVRWIVFKEPVEVSKLQIEEMHRVMGDNNRPVQPLNARVILE